MKRWVYDLLLGVRLAVGGGRTSWSRLALTGIGIGFCVAVLLTAVSVPTALSARSERSNAMDTMMSDGKPVPGVDALYLEQAITDFRSQNVRGAYLRAAGPNTARPPGVDRIPANGEILVSPALAELLASPEGELLRPRLPEKIVGTIGQDGLLSPLDLRFYAGDETIVPTQRNVIYSFGAPARGPLLNPIMWVLIVVGAVLLLFPVLIFVGVSARMAAAQRDRRLAALRLVGAGAGRVRLIASGEALLGSFAGLVIGFGIFFWLRNYAVDVAISEISVFESDLMPSLPLTVLVVLLVPAMAVLTSLVAMRRTVVEPLGVVRETRPVRRRLWWRLVPVLGGAGLLASQIGALDETSRPAEIPLIAGVTLLLLGIPVLLPWLVERTVFRMRGGGVALHLAVRRLQLDSGTSARVVGGVAVVLAGAIGLQTIVSSVENVVLEREVQRTEQALLQVQVQEDMPTDGISNALRTGRGVREVHEIRYVTVKAGDTYTRAGIGDCAALRTEAEIGDCQDGAAFLTLRAGERPEVRGGQQVEVGGRQKTKWTVPPLQQVSGPQSQVLLLTPAAVKGLPTDTSMVSIQASLDPAVPDVGEHARNSLAGFRWKTSTYYIGPTDAGEIDSVFGGIRNGLMAGAFLTLLLAAASLLVLALEQVRERRRPLAVLAATGVPRRTLAMSILWQNGLPLVISMVVAVGTGVGLGVLLLKILGEELALDWAAIGTLTGAATAVVLLVTLLTLPSLRRATGALGLRTE